jgi:hypothetical protein
MRPLLAESLYSVVHAFFVCLPAKALWFVMIYRQKRKWNCSYLFANYSASLSVAIVHDNDYPSARVGKSQNSFFGQLPYKIKSAWAYHSWNTPSCIGMWYMAGLSCLSLIPWNVFLYYFAYLPEGNNVPHCLASGIYERRRCPSAMRRVEGAPGMTREVRGYRHLHHAWVHPCCAGSLSMSAYPRHKTNCTCRSTIGGECDVGFATSPDRYLSRLPLFPDGGIYAKVQLDLSLSFMVLPPSSDDLIDLCFSRTYRSMMVGVAMPSRVVCCRATRGDIEYTR